MAGHRLLDEPYAELVRAGVAVDAVPRGRRP